MRFSGTVFLLGIFSGLLGASGAVLAQTTGFSGCYARTYDAAYLAAHGAQRVSGLAVRVSASPAGSTYPYGLEMTLWLRGERENRFAVASCAPLGTGFRCPIEDDGGEVRLTRVDAGLRVENTLGINAARMGDKAADRRIRILPSNPEHKMFELARAGAQECK